MLKQPNSKAGMYLTLTANQKYSATMKWGYSKTTP